MKYFVDNIDYTFYYDNGFYIKTKNTIYSLVLNNYRTYWYGYYNISFCPEISTTSTTSTTSSTSTTSTTSEAGSKAGSKAGSISNKYIINIIIAHYNDNHIYTNKIELIPIKIINISDKHKLSIRKLSRKRNIDYFGNRREYIAHDYFKYIFQNISYYKKMKDKLFIILLCLKRKYQLKYIKYICLEIYKQLYGVKTYKKFIHLYIKY